ncbi:MAG: hypothetical protein RIS36_575 [Pseudomonadota bacterium]|jgi:hypothetical protein
MQLVNRKPAQLNAYNHPISLAILNSFRSHLDLAGLNYVNAQFFEVSGCISVPHRHLRFLCRNNSLRHR